MNKYAMKDFNDKYVEKTPSDMHRRMAREFGRIEEGYKLKYNVNDTYYYMGLDSILPVKCIQRIYPYQIYEKENYKVDSIPARVIYKGDLYIQD